MCLGLFTLRFGLKERKMCIRMTASYLDLFLNNDADTRLHFNIPITISHFSAVTCPLPLRMVFTYLN